MSIRWAVFLLMAAPAVACCGEGGLRIPRASSATVTRGEDQATVNYPFGKVEFSVDAIHESKEPPAEKGILHAQTHGRFNLSYELARDGAALVARKIKVRVANREEYKTKPTAKLRDHEAMHRRINETEARRMERDLAGFRVEGMTPRAAEKELKARFQKEVAAVRALHAEWDENHVFLSTAPVRPE